VPALSRAPAGEGVGLGGTARSCRLADRGVVAGGTQAECPPVSDDAGMITGAVIPPGGGLTV
jgi:hypothetical protein